ncbi:hypothetical protein MERGE_001241 [Pneumocystis wakefieldiae]|uniref:HECT-type E3 ubiquitin transferase n=1 Tax=Pneumocystis wakefieldiae TaxID=38082 RepID=A0A899G2P9_9ASCO|nr:hypothetical protein MERGE_001241 [Pneumocystis wakefieldiae]
MSIFMFFVISEMIKNYDNYNNMKFLNSFFESEKDNTVFSINIWNNIFDDGFESLCAIGKDIKKPINIVFIDWYGLPEVAIDGGCITKEFLTCICKQALNVNFGLFYETFEYMFYPNPHSYACESSQLQCFEFLGRLIEFRKTTTIELIPGGSDISVTNTNHLQYIYTMADYRLNKVISKKSCAFAKGSQELQEIIGGSSLRNDIDDLRNNSVYGGFQDVDPAIELFWSVYEFSVFECQTFLKFVIYVSRPSLLGFKDLKSLFCIRDGGNNTNRLPTASTSINFLIHPRKKIWEILICPEDKKLESKIDWKLLPVHKDENQVQLDVNRSFIHYPKNLSNVKIEKKRKELNSLIVEILRKHPNLNYFQGYHDIAQVFLLCIGRKDAVRPLELMSLSRIRDHLEFIKLIVQKKDQELGKHIANAPSHFALASYLTWFSHEIKDLKHILEIFDFILATDTAMVLYIYAAIIIQKKNEIMIIDKGETDILHKFLNNLSQECHSKYIFRKMNKPCHILHRLLRVYLNILTIWLK